MNPYEISIVLPLPPESPQRAAIDKVVAEMGDSFRDEMRTCLIRAAEDGGMSHDAAVEWADDEMAKPLNIRVGVGVVL